MLRPIDAYTLNNALVSWYNDTEDETEKSILRRVMQMVVHAPTLTPPNDPLTLDELREMLGKPVYIIANDMGIAEWNVISGKKSITIAYDYPTSGFKNVVTDIVTINGRKFRLDTYGTSWLAYRRPPEGEADA